MTVLVVGVSVLALVLVVRVAIVVWSDRDDPLSNAWRDEHAGRRDDDL